MAGALLEVQGVSKRFGGLWANRGVDLAVRAGEIVGLIGPNGAGKTTLFATIAGFHRPDGGRIAFGGHRIDGLPPERICQLGLARTFQIVRVFREMTVLENVMVGAFCRQPRWREAERRAREVLELVGLAHRAEVLGGALTIAEKKRVELARALATGPRLLLLDEVMAGLNPAERAAAVELVRRVRAGGVSVLMVEHVMEVIMPISDRLVVLDGGRKIAEGSPAEIGANPDVIRAYLGERWAARLGLARAAPEPAAGETSGATG